MRKILINTISIIGASAIILLSVCLPINAISETCLEDHFERLELIEIDNDGNGSTDQTITVTPPSENTCPYVAMSMLLSFYDTYWNDGFVIDKYEWDNGIYHSQDDTLIRTFSAIEEAEDWNNYIDDLNLNFNDDTSSFYRQYLIYEEKYKSYLEPYLVSLGMNLRFHDNPNDTLGLPYYEAAAVLRYYLIGVREFSESQISVEFRNESDYDVISKMKQMISNGFPVYYAGKRRISDTEKSGHAMIAYGIDEHGNIKLHTGWAGDEYRILLVVPGTEGYYRTSLEDDGDEPVLTEYTINKSIIWLEINEENLPHTHAYNYVDSVTGESLCSCQIYETHPEHENNHKYYTRVDYDKEWEKCACGKTNILHFHDKIYTKYEGYHSVECTLCDYSTDIGHTYTLHPISEIQHQKICVCGKTGIIDSHSISKFTYKSQMLHNIVCECGYIFGTQNHSVVQDNNRTSHCVDCGAVFNNFSDIIIKKDDPEYETK